MTLASDLPANARTSSAGVRERLGLVVVATGLLAAILRFPGPFDGNGDTAWLLIVAGRMLDGAVLYRDVFETNPPMSALLYIPMVAVARSLGLAPEIMTYAAVSGLALGALAVCARLLPALGVEDRAARQALLAVVAFALLIMPTRCFAQREHIAAIALVPYLLVLAARWSGPFRPGIGLVTVAGLGAGLALCIKPHFGAILALAHLLVAGQGLRALGVPRALREGRLAPPEALIALATFAAYVALVITQFPEFLTVMLPRVALTYVPHSLSPSELLAQPASLTALAALAMIVLARPRRWSPLFLVYLAGAFGGLLSYVVQAKGWSYHQLPALTFAALAFSVAWLDGRTDAGQRLLAVSPALIGAAAIFGGFAPGLFATHAKPRALEAEIRRHAPRPTLLLASSNLGAAFPLVRRVDGQWVGRSPSLWMSEGAQALGERSADPARRRELAALFALDRAQFSEDARKHRPDVLVLSALDPESDLLPWALADAGLAALLQDYRQVAVVEGMRLFIRNDGPSASR